MSSKDIRKEMNEVISDLEKNGVDVNSVRGLSGDDKEYPILLGDKIEKALQKFGITEEKFKKWFGLKECGCSKRKKYLNGLFSWKARRDK